MVTLKRKQHGGRYAGGDTAPDLLFDAPAGAGQIFEVHDLTGRLIGQWNLDEGARSLQIETTGWAEGLYACTLRYGKRTLFVSKLSVIR